MESVRCVHISHAVSGETLGIVCKKHEHQWTTFVTALHYYAARRCGVPVWCMDLLWEYDPWDQAQLPMYVHIKCSISSELPEIADSCDSDGRCDNCWEDCEDLDVGRASILYSFFFWNCRTCGTNVLCDLCKVHFPDGSVCCLYCLVPDRTRIRRGLSGPYEEPEADEDYRARVAAALAGLTEAQQKRWRLVNSTRRCSLFLTEAQQRRWRL